MIIQNPVIFQSQDIEFLGWHDRMFVKCAAFARKHLCRNNSITRVRGDQIHSIRQMSWCSVPMGRKLPSRTPFPSPHRNYPPIWLSCVGCHEMRNVNRNTQSFSVLQLSHSNCVKHQARMEKFPSDQVTPAILAVPGFLRSSFGFLLCSIRLNECKQASSK